MGTYVRLFDLKLSPAVHSTKSQRHNIFGLKIEEIYTLIFLENKIKEYILHPISLKIFYIEDICKSFHEEGFLHHLR
ncbi:hypothetical protein GIB67_017274 [Kingdonia uniflora]|uniref:Uncharacterized protein n=1 Tax=Kingdonia uniflora TaxID=39325 RepID=A0A7J7N3F3_9MAGN|nr:hypothetical protein GIB67_017274 [Kingdonia uniflora]